MVESSEGTHCTVLGSVGHNVEGGNIKLKSANGEIFFVDSETFSKNYTVIAKFDLMQISREDLKSNALFCPLMVQYTGRRFSLIAVVRHQAMTKNMLVVFQCLESKNFYSLPVDQFYDQFSPAQTFVFAEKPRPIDADDSLGYLVNEDGGVERDAPLLYIHYDCESGDLMAEAL